MMVLSASANVRVSVTGTVTFADEKVTRPDRLNSAGYSELLGMEMM